MERRFLYLTVFLFLCIAIFGGDVASYVNLGFSNDSKYFLFGQYGIDTENSSPYAELYFVDVYNNKFVYSDVKKETYPVEIKPGFSGEGALFKILHDNSNLISEYSIDHLLKGRILYLLVNGEAPKSHLEFRDFYKGSNLTIDLNQEQFKQGDSYSSSFHINLELTDSTGNRREFMVGLPSYKRSNVKRYRIKQVFYSPDETSLVFVVEKEFAANDGIDIRYMVETVKIY